MAGPDQPQTPQEMASVLLSKFSGLKNTVGIERLNADELAVAKNIDIDDLGQPRRRRGYRSVVSGNCHSLWRAQDDRVLVVKDGVLGLLYPNYSFSPLMAGIGPNALAYTQVGPQVYFSSQTDSGVIRSDNIVDPWGMYVSAGQWLSPVVNPVADLPPIRGKLLGRVPMATCHAYWNGRIYLGAGRVVWATEYGLYNLVDKTKNFHFYEDDVTVIGAVTDGYYVGTKSAVYWVSGSVYGEQKRQTLQAYGAIPGTLCYVPAELVNPQVPQGEYTGSKNAVVFLTDTGIVAGLDGGQLFNLTEDKFLFPAALRGASLFRRQDGVNQYLTVIDSDGQPSDASRFGDYLEADIVRRGEWGNLVDGVIFGEAWDAAKV